jgi:hypothetical protein
MQTRRWVNHSQPQTMQIAVFLLYFDAVFSALAFLRSTSLILLILVAAQAGAGYGIANEKKWGYWLGVAMAFAPFILRMVFLGPGYLLSGDALSLMFEIALVALLLHPQSREYQRIWFR